MTTFEEQIKDGTLSEVFAESQGLLERVVMEVMQEVYARLPYGQKFQLSDGSTAYLKKFIEPRICPYENHSFTGSPQLGFDVVLENGKLDHIEFAVFQSGWGRALAEPIVDETTGVKK